MASGSDSKSKSKSITKILEELDMKSVRALLDSTRMNHMTLKSEIKLLATRFVYAGDFDILSTHMHAAPPLHSLFDLLDDLYPSVLMSPTELSPRPSSVGKGTPKSQKRVFTPTLKPASKKLKYSPRNSPSVGKPPAKSSPSSIFQEHPVKVEEAGESDDDDMVGIEAM